MLTTDVSKLVSVADRLTLKQ